MDKTEKFIRTLKIKTKDNRIEPSNLIRRHCDSISRREASEENRVRIIILKARQMVFLPFSEA